MTRKARWTRILEGMASFFQDFMWGSAYSWLSTMQSVKRRGVLEHMFAFSLYCDLGGFPLLPGISSLRLLPFMVPQILTWRRARYLWSDELESAARHLHH